MKVNKFLAKKVKVLENLLRFWLRRSSWNFPPSEWKQQQVIDKTLISTSLRVKASRLEIFSQQVFFCFAKLEWWASWFLFDRVIIFLQLGCPTLNQSCRISSDWRHGKSKKRTLVKSKREHGKSYKIMVKVKRDHGKKLKENIGKKTNNSFFLCSEFATSQYIQDGFGRQLLSLFCPISPNPHSC